MRVKRRAAALAVVAVLGSLSGSGVALATHQRFATAEATQHPVNQSGAHGHVMFTQTADGVAVAGTATGLEPSVGRYETLVYDVGSVPGGPVACEPTGGLGFTAMFVGVWSVDAAGNGTLIQLNRAIAPIGEFDSVSIRDTTINRGIGPEAVVACGQVAAHPAAE